MGLLCSLVLKIPIIFNSPCVIIKRKIGIGMGSLERIRRWRQAFYQIGINFYIDNTSKANEGNNAYHGL